MAPADAPPAAPAEAPVPPPPAPPAKEPLQQQEAGAGDEAMQEAAPAEAVKEEAAAAPPPAGEEAAAAPAAAAAEPAEPVTNAEAEPAPEAKQEPKEEAEAEDADKEGSPAVAEPPSDATLVARLRELLAEVDLATTTEKQLRKKLEGEYGCSLADRKALLRAEINAYLEAGEAEEEAEEEVEEEEEEEEEAGAGRKRKASGSSLGSYLSPEMQEFLGEERMPRTQVVKKLWEYIKANGLQDPKDKRVIVFDDKLKVLFPGTKTTMFKLQKLLSKHCKTSDVVGGSDEEEEEEEEVGSGEEAEARPAPKRARRASSAPKSSGSRRRGSSAASEGGEKKQTGFTKPCKLSDELAAWVGKPTASRPEITKHFWAYIKEKGLQDPADKSYVLSDDALKGLTGETRFKAFGFSKFMSQHIQGYA